MAQISKAKLWLMEQVLGSEEKIRAPFKAVDWTQAVTAFQKSDFAYPEYYNRDFHRVPGGYLQPDAAVTYDPVTALIVMPNETKIRTAFVEQVKKMLGKTQPNRILDLAVGTGTAALAWREAFPNAAITGIDLSPYMLVAANLKLKEKNVELLQADAQNTDFADASFDLITAAFLFHEVPQATAAKVLAEAYRLLAPGGTFAVFDGNQHSNFLVKMVGGYFPEPYIKDYMNSDLEIMCREVGFISIQTKRYRQLYQFLTAVRPAHT